MRRKGRGRGASLLTLLPTCSHMQARCAHVLESSATHYTIIALTLLDLGIVVTELILSSIFPAAEKVPHAGARGGGGGFGSTACPPGGVGGFAAPRCAGWCPCRGLVH